jgi:hypothetical protein
MPTTQEVILTAGNMALTLHSLVVDLGAVGLGSIQAVFTGSPVGSLFLELSDDIVPPGADPNSVITNWTTYTGSAYAVTAAGNYVFNISNMGYKWLRMTYVPSSGSGSLSAIAAAKND